AGSDRMVCPPEAWQQVTLSKCLICIGMSICYIRPRMKRLYWYLACLFLATPILAQNTDSHKPFTLNVNVNLVELHVTMVDDKDRSIGGLSKEHFKIFENRTNQPIAVFKHEDVPVSLGLVVDNSRSIEPRKQRLDAAALSFVRNSNPDDETFVVHFDSE